jgi:hypothetical protein
MATKGKGHAMRTEVERELEMRRREEKAARLEAARALARGLGQLDREGKEAFLDELTRIEHRTCQQDAARLFLGFFEVMAGSRSDPRNEATVELGKAIMGLPARVRSLPRI